MITKERKLLNDLIECYDLDRRADFDRNLSDIVEEARALPSPPTESDEDGHITQRRRTRADLGVAHSSSDPVGAVTPPSPDARAAALEEAAQYAENTRIEPGLFADDIAAGIRQLIDDAPSPLEVAARIRNMRGDDVLSRRFGSEHEKPCNNPKVTTCDYHGCQDANECVGYPPAPSAEGEKDEAILENGAVVRVGDKHDTWDEYGVGSDADLDAELEAKRYPNAPDNPSPNIVKLVERLRDPVSRNAWGNAEMFEEAATALEALRKECEHKDGWFALTLRKLEEAQARVAELEERLAEAQAQDRIAQAERHRAQQACEQAHARIQALSKECELLREAWLSVVETPPLEAAQARIQELEGALEKIGAYEHIPGGTSDKLAKIARAALAKAGG